MQNKRLLIIFGESKAQKAGRRRAISRKSINSSLLSLHNAPMTTIYATKPYVRALLNKSSLHPKSRRTIPTNHIKPIDMY
jgi:hypothetical protein